MNPGLRECQQFKGGGLIATMGAPPKTLTLSRVLACDGSIYALELWPFEAVDHLAFVELSKRRHYLNLSGLRSLSDEDAQVFSRHPGILDLSGVTEVSDLAATHLAEKRGGLWLNGLTSVSDEAAVSLSKHEGDLYLWGLTELTDTANKLLSKHNIFLSTQIKLRPTTTK